MHEALALSGGTLTFFQIFMAIVIILIAMALCLWHFLSIGFWSDQWLLTILLTVFAVITFDNLEAVHTVASVLFFVLGIWATFSWNKVAGVVLILLHLLQFVLVFWLAYSLYQGGFPMGYYNF